MSTAAEFLPDAGSFFYVECRPFDRVVDGGLFGSPTAVKHKDNSWSDSIFLCKTQDSRVVVGATVVGGYGIPGDRIFQRAKHQFFPVGPDVMKALRLDERSEQ